MPRRAASSTGKYVIPLQNTTQQPLLTALTDRAMREKLFNNRWTRTEKGDANDTRADHRANWRQSARRKAKLLGYPNYAAYVLYDQMAETPAKVREIPRPAGGADRAPRPPTKRRADPGGHRQGRPAFRSEALGLGTLRRTGAQRNATTWTRMQLKPYFELHTVLQNGVFYAANQLYGITFKQRHDIPVYQPDVMVYRGVRQGRLVAGPDVFRLFQARQQIRAAPG